MIIVLWPLLCIAIACVASRRGRSGLGWFLIAFFLSPLMAGILLLCLGPKLTDAQQFANQRAQAAIAADPEFQRYLAAKRDKERKQQNIGAAVAVGVLLLIVAVSTIHKPARELPDVAAAFASSSSSSSVSAPARPQRHRKVTSSATSASGTN